MSKIISKRRRRGRGAVLLIATMLFCSALLRFSEGAGQVIAQVASTSEKMSDNAKEGMPGTRNTQAYDNPDRPKVAALLTALREREERVKAREAQIEVRSKALAVADVEIEKRLAALEQAEQNLRKTLSLADGAAENDLARLTTVYESMKPKDAAALFSTMEPNFAAGFIARMRPEAAAAVMTGLPSDVAYSISVILAGRNATAPKT